jgi:hypothetical protein
VSLALALLAAGALSSPAALVSYSFEDDVETGPDTFAVFQHAKGTVGLSRAFRVSGYRALEIRDEAGDRDFPELQGYFPLRREGRLFVHFAFLTTAAHEEWNAALAGPGWFSLGARDGMAFWLAAHEGVLVHYSDSIPKRLLRLEPFVWYAVDVDYDVAGGRYHLTVRREGLAEPVVLLRDQANAANRPGSAVQVFSFIGDLADRSRVAYYVDDVIVSTEPPATLPPFVAPGRRTLFVDAYREHQKKARAESICLDTGDPRDFGLADGLPGEAGLRALAAWKRGCGDFAAGRTDDALAAFTRAASLWPTGGIYRLSAALALARAGRREEAARELAQIEGAWHDDPRFAVASALAGAPADPRAAREHAYFVLLWDGRLGEARDLALEKAGEGTRAERAAWLENAGDAALLAGAAAEARALYERSLELAEVPSALLKLSDAAHLLGDVEAERACRERIYGALRER